LGLDLFVVAREPSLMRRKLLLDHCVTVRIEDWGILRGIVVEVIWTDLELGYGRERQRRHQHRNCSVKSELHASP
jgi:hypothetical protein